MSSSHLVPLSPAASDVRRRLQNRMPRRAEPRGDQLLEPQRGGRQPAGKLGHEGDARLADAVAEDGGFVVLQLEGGGAVDGLAGVAGGVDRQRAEPLGGEQQDGVDVAAGREGAEAVVDAGAELPGGLLGPVLDGVAEGGDFEAVGQRPQRGQMPRFPQRPDAHDADPDFHKTVWSAKSEIRRRVRTADALRRDTWSWRPAVAAFAAQ